jgi:hypothetical protein
MNIQFFRALLSTNKKLQNNDHGTFRINTQFLRAFLSADKTLQKK